MVLLNVVQRAKNMRSSGTYLQHRVNHIQTYTNQTKVYEHFIISHSNRGKLCLFMKEK